MKKILAFVLALCLLFSCTALASAPITDYTLMEKWDLQMQGSGFKGHLSFNADGENAFGMDASLWQLLKNLLPALSAEVNSMPRSGNRDTRVQLLWNGEKTGHATVLTDGVSTLVKSDILGEDEYAYQFGKTFDLLGLFAENDSKWPDLKNTLLRILGASDEWKEKAAPLFGAYTSRLALWMQEYMDVSGESTENGYETHMSCLIPAEDVKVQMKRMLSMLYQDGDMLDLLSQVLTGAEMNAYLNRANQDIFFIMLDLLPMDGDVEIQRVYDEQGVALLDKITLPFADVSPYAQLSLTVTNQDNITTRSFKLICRDGRTTDVALKQMDEGTVTGSVRMDIAAEDGTVGVRAFTFNCAWDKGEETYDLENDKCQHLSDLSVLIKPTEEDTTGLKETTLSVRINVESKSSRRAATYITVDAALTDQETGSVLGMLFTCNTASPWTPEMISTWQGDVTKLDDMQEDELEDLGTLLRMNVEGYFSRLLMQAVPETVEE